MYYVVMFSRRTPNNIGVGSSHRNTGYFAVVTPVSFHRIFDQPFYNSMIVFAVDIEGGFTVGRLNGNEDRL